MEGSKFEENKFTCPPQLPTNHFPRSTKQGQSSATTWSKLTCTNPNLVKLHQVFNSFSQNQDKLSVVPGPGQGSHCRAWTQTKASPKFRTLFVLHGREPPGPRCSHTEPAQSKDGPRWPHGLCSSVGDQHQDLDVNTVF